MPANHVAYELYEGSDAGDRKYKNGKPRERRQEVKETDHSSGPHTKTPRASKQLIYGAHLAICVLFLSKIGHSLLRIRFTTNEKGIAQEARDFVVHE